MIKSDIGINFIHIYQKKEEKKNNREYVIYITI